MHERSSSFTSTSTRPSWWATLRAATASKTVSIRSSASPLSSAQRAAPPRTLSPRMTSASSSGGTARRSPRLVLLRIGRRRRCCRSLIGLRAVSRSTRTRSSRRPTQRSSLTPTRPEPCTGRSLSSSSAPFACPPATRSTLASLATASTISSCQPSSRRCTRCTPRAGTSASCCAPSARTPPTSPPPFPRGQRGSIPRWPACLRSPSTPRGSGKVGTRRRARRAASTACGGRRPAVASCTRRRRSRCSRRGAPRLQR
mmetsp:Transcript_6553/g.14306  ORF Transcript_6553/g.14306 Transcript_6553/m.14306 type:complete len:257 (+) Transcript_6553:184-954(+)